MSIFTSSLHPDYLNQRKLFLSLRQQNILFCGNFRQEKTIKLPIFLTKIFNPNFRFVQQFLCFQLNIDVWSTFWLLTRISIFDHNFKFYHNFHFYQFLLKISRNIKLTQNVNFYIIATSVLFEQQNILISQTNVIFSEILDRKWRKNLRNFKIILLKMRAKILASNKNVQTFEV